MNLLEFDNFYLVGIKGVGMATFAQLLVDAGKNVFGCDVEEDFVTKGPLDRLGIKVDIGFDRMLPQTTECLIYTAAHQGESNPLVKQAEKAGLAVLSHAEALSLLFNQKKGIAVCGVGGKSTTSAMLAWIFEKTGRDISYAVGVAEINGLGRSGRWSDSSEYFIAEADEYAANPSAVKEGDEAIPRFAYLNPQIIVSKQIAFDHPDVYRDFNHTLDTFNSFFANLKPNGTLIVPETEAAKVSELNNQQLWVYGKEGKNFSCRFNVQQSVEGKTIGTLTDHGDGSTYTLELSVPGEFNFDNAVAAAIAAKAAGIPIQESISALKDFSSTKRRFEKVTVKYGAIGYDDYAHHPSELTAAINALKQWYPTERKIIIFQPHTYSRTKELFTDFVASLSGAEELIITDIFASARESVDPEVSSAKLAEAVRKANPQSNINYFGTVAEAAAYLKNNLDQGDIFLTVGAGDIYELHDML